MAGDQKRRRNHTVQAALLQRFTDSHGRLTRVPLEGNPHRVRYQDATVIKDFYTIRTEDGSIDDSFERSLADLEAPLGPALRALIDEACWPIPPETRSYLARWITLQLLRTPFFRSFGDSMKDVMFRASINISTAADFGRYLEERGKHFPPNEVRHLFDMYHEPGAIPGGSLAEHIGMIHQFEPRTTATILERGWTFFRNDDHGFITSDHPVATRMRTKPDANADIWGILGEVVVSLDRHVALVVGEDTHDDRWMTINMPSAQFINQEIAHFARQAIYHHPDDEPTRSLVLPPPYRRKGTVEQWLNELINGPDKDPS